MFFHYFIINNFTEVNMCELYPTCDQDESEEDLDLDLQEDDHHVILGYN